METIKRCGERVASVFTRRASELQTQTFKHERAVVISFFLLASEASEPVWSGERRVVVFVVFYIQIAGFVFLCSGAVNMATSSAEPQL